MTTRFRIKSTNPGNPQLVSRLRNLGEDLHRTLGDNARIDMKAVDAATEEFWIEVPSKRHLGEVTALLKRQIAHAAKDGAFTFERL